jgi:hypothetical protein
MADLMANLRIIIWISVIGLTLVLYPIAFGTASWGKLDVTDGTGESDVSVTTNIGLWRTCATVIGVSGCTKDLGDPYNRMWFKASKAMAILGLLCLLGAAALVSTVLVIALRSADNANKSIFVIFSVLLNFSAAFFIMVLLCVFGIELRKFLEEVANKTPASVNTEVGLGFSFDLGVASLILLIGAGIVGVLELIYGRNQHLSIRADALLNDG